MNLLVSNDYQANKKQIFNSGRTLTENVLLLKIVPAIFNTFGDKLHLYSVLLNFLFSHWKVDLHIGQQLELHNKPSALLRKNVSLDRSTH